jgi:predicted transcriptional regulator
MRMRRRLIDQILASILETCSCKGVTKTKVVYFSGMNFNTIQPYLELLINDGLLEVMDSQPAIYKTTSKGLEVLGHIKALEALVPRLSAVFGETNK